MDYSVNRRNVQRDLKLNWQKGCQKLYQVCIFSVITIHFVCKVQ